MIKKSDFIRSLQVEARPLSPFEISQRIRLIAGCVSIYLGDPLLKSAEIRGYMIKWGDKPDRSPDNPELYPCVIALDQSKAWQDVVWIKEILQILDDPSHRTHDREKLVQMIGNRHAHTPHNGDTPKHVLADKDGFILALGSSIPLLYRNTLRRRPGIWEADVTELEKEISVPAEFIHFILNDGFEGRFEAALNTAN